MSEFFVIAGFAVAVCVGVFTLVLAIALPFSAASCHATADQMQLPSQFSIWTDCMVSVDGRWMPISSYKVMRPTQ